MVVLLRVFYFTCVELADTANTVLLVDDSGRFTLCFG